MAEGPVVHHYAKRLRKVLEGRPVRVRFGLKNLKGLEPSFEDLRVERVEAHGKQFRILFEDGRALLVHLLMWGAWRIYGNGDAWDKPAARARLVLETSAHTAVAFSAPDVRVLDRGELERDTKLGGLGPDPLRDDFSIGEFFRRLEEKPEREIGDALLDQRVVAGVGNVLRIEILFGAHVDPRRRVGTLSKKEKDEILRWTLKLMGTWMKEMGRKKRWIRIYRRSGSPCPRCGEAVRFFRQAGRITHACPACQR